MQEMGEELAYKLIIKRGRKIEFDKKGECNFTGY